MKNNGSKESRFIVLVNIENKPYISDPEGDTILRDLVLKEGYSIVESIRSAKALKMKVRARNPKHAEKIVKRICDELRIFNPIVSNCTVRVIETIS
ncbi:MAG: phosphoribosylformylglycinamidine synthase subunit PurS [Nitrososphaeraceae archaeon]|jgi:phosphoribosylformylglycinamidine synthase subunit PurS